MVAGSAVGAVMRRTGAVAGLELLAAVDVDAVALRVAAVDLESPVVVDAAVALRVAAVDLESPVVDAAVALRVAVVDLESPVVVDAVVALRVAAVGLESLGVVLAVLAVFVVVLRVVAVGLEPLTGLAAVGLLVFFLAPTRLREDSAAGCERAGGGADMDFDLGSSRWTRMFRLGSSV